MFQSLIFSLFFSATVLDLLFFRSSFSWVSVLFVFLKIQSDIAASNYLKSGAPINSETPPEEDYFAQVRISNFFTDDIVQPPLETAKVLPFKPHAKAEPTLTKKPKNRKPFELPKFNGEPHEVLGIEENALTKKIQKAFRHWIKHYHPDHQQAQVNQKATIQARKLHEAKQKMLDTRAKSRMAKAA